MPKNIKIFKDLYTVDVLYETGLFFGVYLQRSLSLTD